jgi:hypothetical protein
VASHAPDTASATSPPRRGSTSCQSTWADSAERLASIAQQGVRHEHRREERERQREHLDRSDQRLLLPRHERECVREAREPGRQERGRDDQDGDARGASGERRSGDGPERDDHDRLDQRHDHRLHHRPGFLKDATRITDEHAAALRESPPPR